MEQGGETGVLINKTFFCNIDGSCAPDNPNGNLGWGYQVYDKEICIMKVSGYAPAVIGNTNNMAEYTALLHLLQVIPVFYTSGDKVIIYTDSKLIYRQMVTRDAQILRGAYTGVAKKCMLKLTTMPYVRIIWDRREFNDNADQLSRVLVNHFISNSSSNGIKQDKGKGAKDRRAEGADTAY